MNKTEWYFLRCIYLLTWGKKGWILKSYILMLFFSYACGKKKKTIQGGKAQQKAGNIQCKQDTKYFQFKCPAGFRPFLWTQISCGKYPGEICPFLFPTYECLHNFVFAESAGEFYSWINSGVPLKCSSLGSEDPSYQGHHSPKAFPIFSLLPGGNSMDLSLF